MMADLVRVLAVLFALFFSGTADAHSWMIRHGYTNCAQCHLDPSGAGLLSDYGRAQGEILLRTPYEERDADWEPGPAKEFLWGIVPLPDWLELGGSSRTGGLQTEGSDKIRFIQMQADLRTQITAGPVRGYGSIAIAEEGARGALITSQPDMNVVSREHWLGWDVNDDILIRAGRMPLPFGLRVDEHTLLTRELTQVDINDAQQHGVAASWNGKGIRAEAMGILGNLQLSPDPFRERGATAYVEWAPDAKVAIGASGLFGTMELDPNYLVPRTRMAYGVFGRWNPSTPLVLLGEADLLQETRDGVPVSGHTGFLALDGEITQGVHLKGTGEWLVLATDPDEAADTTTGFWLTGIWYFAPHVDVRVDLINRFGALESQLGLAQLHFYL